MCKTLPPAVIALTVTTAVVPVVVILVVVAEMVLDEELVPTEFIAETR